MHPILDQHDVIAWDMDGTLVDGPNAAFFLSYIALTPQKRHHIITFRNRAWADTCWAELRHNGLVEVKTLIRSVESCPELIHDCFMIRHRLDGAEERRRFLDHRELTRDEFETHAEAFREWKGERAMILGCTILVDDMAPFVLPGCTKHAVTFLHAHADIPPLEQGR